MMKSKVTTKTVKEFNDEAIDKIFEVLRLMEERHNIERQILMDGGFHDSQFREINRLNTQISNILSEVR